MEKYKIARNKVNIGTVIKPLIRIYDKENFNSVETIEFYNIRLTLFSINDNNFSNDLLYATPEYPIESISNPKDYIDSNYMITNQYNLNELLTTLGFNEELTKKDLKKIRKKLLSLKESDILPEEMVTHLNNIKKFTPDKSEGKLKRLR